MAIKPRHSFLKYFDGGALPPPLATPPTEVFSQDCVFVGQKCHLVLLKSHLISSQMLLPFPKSAEQFSTQWCVMMVNRPHFLLLPSRLVLVEAEEEYAEEAGFSLCDELDPFDSEQSTSWGGYKSEKHTALSRSNHFLNKFKLAFLSFFTKPCHSLNILRQKLNECY